MKQIGDLFEKYRKTLRAPQASVEKECVKVIVEVTGFSITQNQLSYTVSTRTLHLKMPSVLKQEILLQREAILSALKSHLHEQSYPKTIL